MATTTECKSCGDANLAEYRDPNAKDWCVFCATT